MGAFDPEVYQDEKIKKTLEMLEEGKTKDEIAEHFGHGWSGVNQYFLRRGFRWDREGHIFVPKEEEVKVNEIVEDARFLATKAGQIIRQLSQKHANIKQIAVKSGFKTVDDMGTYMKGQGFVWNNELGNYEYDETLVQKQAVTTAQLQPSSISFEANGSDEYQNLLKYLLSKKERLLALLETESDGILPRYKFTGAKANKTLGLPTTVMTLLNDFSKEFNVTQRAIIEIALAEFFKKYGYEEQLNSVLQA
ncbi:hypothetical protein [Metabacillus fastidiosus]|uniref:hypothetical protein n=1 Tax=Metabacillus fastidiosus TaxID=1458 RepID=UPI003D2C4A46